MSNCVIASYNQFLNKKRLSHPLYNWQTSIKGKNKANRYKRINKYLKAGEYRQAGGYRKADERREAGKDKKVGGYRKFSRYKEAGRYRRGCGHLLQISILV